MYFSLHTSDSSDNNILVILIRMFKPAQMMPFPRKPSRQAQKKLPSVSVQVAFILQLSVSLAHSSISADQPRNNNYISC